MSEVIETEARSRAIEPPLGGRCARDGVRWFSHVPRRLPGRSRPASIGCDGNRFECC
jgi:hypothetical protein